MIRHDVLIVCLVSVFIASGAKADMAPAASAARFIPLSRAHFDARKPALPSAQVGQARFFSLNRKQNFSVPQQMAHNSIVPVVKEESPVHSATAKIATPSTMTDEQAKQLLSIFVVSD